eukprot:gene34377-41609_t
MSGSAAKIQTSLSRARVQNQHYLSKERASTKPQEEKDPQSGKGNMRYLDHSAVGERDLVVELYCRSAKGGMWSFFKEILINDVTTNSIESFKDNLLNGGIQEEIERSVVAEKVSSQCFGAGMGASPLLPTLLLLNPQFKRLKPHLVQFGYKCAFDDSVTIVRRGKRTQSRKSTSFPTTPLASLDVRRESALVYKYKPNEKDIRDCITSLGDRFAFLLPLLQQIEDFTLSMSTDTTQGQGPTELENGGESMEYDHLLIASDGSMTFNPPSTTCAVYLLPYTAPHPAEAAPAGTGNSFQPLAPQDVRHPPLMRGLSVQVAPLLAPVPPSPLFAEALASLSAHMLALLSLAQGQQGGMKDVKLTFLTDSRALLRILKSTASGSRSDPVAGGGDMQSLLTLLAAVQGLVSERAAGKVQYEWTEGHIERQEEDPSLWPLFSTALFVADEACKKDGEVGMGAEVRQRFEQDRGFDFSKGYVLQGAEVVRAIAFAQAHM